MKKKRKVASERWRERIAGAGERWLDGVAIAGTITFLVVLAFCALSSADFDWNPRRLVRAFAFLRGLSVYYPLGGGPLISGFNGPTQILAYLPATLASTPAWAARLGVLLSLLWFYVPAFFAVHVLAGGDRGNRTVRLLGFAAFGLLCIGSLSLRASSTLIHGDAPSLGLSFLACALLIGAREEAPSPRRLAAIAACTIFAVSTKVTVLPIAVAIPLYTWFRYGRKPATLLLGWQTGIGAVLFGIYAAVFGLGFFTVNLVTPVNIPWVGSLTHPQMAFAETPLAKLRILAAAAFELSTQAETFLVLFLFAATLLARRATPREIERKHFWLPLLIALALIPPSLLGRVKLGGGMNTLSPALAFVVLALIAILVETASEKRGELERWLLAGLLVVLTVNRAPLGAGYASIWKSQSRNLHDEAFRFSLRHPGKAYFPEYPLSGLMADGRVYHSLANISEYGRHLASSLKEEDFRRHIPANVETIALRNPDFASIVGGYLSEFAVGAPIDELPGWIILRKTQKKAAIPVP